MVDIASSRRGAWASGEEMWTTTPTACSGIRKEFRAPSLRDRNSWQVPLPKALTIRSKLCLSHGVSTHRHESDFLASLISCNHLRAVPGPRISIGCVFKKHPGADLNKDGILTLEEAKTFRKGTPRSPDSPPKPRGRATVQELAKSYEAREFNGLLYRFFAPDSEEGKRYPLILSLHGAGGKGNDNLRNLKPWNGPIVTPEFQDKHPCFVVVPQSDQAWRVAGSVPEIGPEEIAGFPEIWQKVAESRRMFLSKSPGGKLGLVFDLLDALARELPIDTDRVYVLGHSMGGFGSFEAIAVQPDRFAAAIPSAGGLSPWHDPAVFKHVPVWAFHGSLDRTVPPELTADVFERLKAAGGNMKFTTLGGVGHGASAYAFSYEGDKMNPKFSTAMTGPFCDPTETTWEWLFAQKRRTD